MQTLTESEIEKDYLQLTLDRNEADEKAKKLDKEIEGYTNFGKVLILLGVVAGIIPFCTDRALNNYGDYAGGIVSCLWSLAGLMYIYVAFLGQKQQLINQQIELKQNQYEIKVSRLEIMKQATQMEDQSKTFKKQRFEDTFFKMIELQTFITSELKTSKKLKEILGQNYVNYTGKEVISVELEKLINDYILRENIQQGTGSDYSEYFSKYQLYDDQTKNSFDRYLSNLNTIYDFICDSNEIDILEKKFYIRIFALQLNEYELAYYFYYHTLHNKFTELDCRRKELDLMKYVSESYLGNISHLFFYKTLPQRENS